MGELGQCELVFRNAYTDNPDVQFFPGAYNKQNYYWKRGFSLGETYKWGYDLNYYVITRRQDSAGYKEFTVDFKRCAAHPCYWV